MRALATPAHPAVLLLPWAALSACIELGPRDREDPVDTGVVDTGEPGEQVWSGSFGEAPLTGAWWVGETWETGGCVQLRLQATELPIETWGAELLLDAPVESWVYGGGDAQVQLLGPEAVALEPVAGSEGIDAGGSVAMSWCSEPLVRPAEVLLAFEAGEPVEPEEEEPEEEPSPFEGEATEGSLDAGGVAGLSWAFSGAWGYEGCYALVFENTSQSAWSSDWMAQLGFAAEVEPLSASGLRWATIDAEHLALYSADGLSIEPGDAVSGSLCVEEGSPLRSVAFSP